MIQFECLHGCTAHGSQAFNSSKRTPRRRCQWRVAGGADAAQFAASGRVWAEGAIAVTAAGGWASTLASDASAKTAKAFCFRPRP